MSKTKKSGLDYNELAQGSDEIRESCGIVVAGLMTDGFTEKQARAIVAGLLGRLSRADAGDDEDDDDE